MDSPKSKRKSRRSSILKVPKPQTQPLKNADLNVTSDPNSSMTTSTRLKRRVSFAEKKHVKEFCDSMEQGTVWDNTYEESELSQRNTQHSNNDENTVNTELANECTKHHSRANILAETNAESISITLQLRGSSSAKENNIYRTTENGDSRAVERVIRDSEFEMVHRREPTRIPLPLNHIGSFEARRSSSASEAFAVTERNAIDFTTVEVESALSSERQTILNSEASTVVREDRNDVVPMDETTNSDTSLDASTRKAPVFHNETLDFTNVIETISSTKEPLALPSNDRTTIFHNESVDFTNIVENIQATIESVMSPPDERPTLFHNKSMDFTNVIDIVRSTKVPETSAPEITTIFHDESVDFTQVVGNVPAVDYETRERILESTTIFQDGTVDFTRVVGNVPTMDDGSRERTPDGTTIFDDASVDFTRVVENVQSTNEPLDSMRAVPENIQASLFDKLASGRDSIQGYARIDKSQPKSSKKIEQAFDSSEVSSVTRQNIGAFDSTISKVLVDSSREDTIPKDAKRFVPKSLAEDNDPEIRSPLAKRSKSLENTTERKFSESFSCATHSAREEVTIRENSSTCSFGYGLQSIDRTDFNDDNNSDREQDATLLHEESMEMTHAIQGTDLRNENPSLARNFNISMETRIGDNGEGKTMVFRNDSMDLTGTVRCSSNVDRPIQQMNKYEECEENGIPKMDNGEGKTMVFRNDSMDLTEAVRCSSNVDRSIQQMNKYEECEENGIPKMDNGEGKTMVFRNDSMDLTGAVRCSSNVDRAIRTNKYEECEGNYTTKMNDKRSSAVFRGDDWTKLTDPMRDDKENCPVDADFTDKSLEINERFESVSSPKRNENADAADAKEQSIFVNFESAEITGVMPFLSEIKEASKRSGDRFFKKDGRTALTNEEGETRSNRRSAEKISPAAEKIHFRSSQVAKELFQKTKPLDGNDKTGTADLEAVIRKLAESLPPEDESGFDQATFLRQQARCMEDYEANSTASQDCNAASRSIDNRESSITADFKMLSHTEAAHDRDAFVDNKDVYAEEKHCLSSKSLEELRYPASKVDKFRIEHTDVLEDLQAMEPPSFAFEESITIGSRSLPMEMNIEKWNEAEERISQRIENIPDVTFDIAGLTITQTVNMEKIVNDTKNENTVDRTERKKMHRSESSFTKETPVSDGTISPLKADHETETTNYRPSNTVLTTADQFSSESADGPSEKLRRGDNVSAIRGKEEEESTKFTDIAGSWASKDFASSTVIVDDSSRRSMHRGTEETCIVSECSLPDELPSVIDTKADISLDKSPFDTCRANIEELAGRWETIWTINRLDEKLLAFNFFSNSIVLAVYLNDNESTHPIKVIGFLSQMVEEGTDPGVSLAHSMIMKRVDSASLTRSYRTYEDIPQMLSYVSSEVKMGMDFMFELDRLRNHNVMEIDGNRISFMVRTRNIDAGIILNVAMEIKSIEEIDCNDIAVSCILGKEKVREKDIKSLITNVKRDHKFLRFYINDVKDYVDLMAETGFSTTSGP